MSETDDKKQCCIYQLINKIPEGYEGTKIILAAFVGALFVIALVVIFHCFCKDSTDKIFCWSIYKNPPWTLLTGLATAPALILLWHLRVKHRNKDIEKGKADIKNADRRLITERFSKAIDHLGGNDEVLNLGAIYELEAISRESQADHWAVVETLSAFIRKNRPLPETGETEEECKKKTGKIPRPPTDIQAALTVLGRRANRDEETDDQRIDLHAANLERTHLFEANLQGADLQEANLKIAYLKRAELHEANLKKACLHMADLRGAQLGEAKLEGAIFTGAKYTPEKSSFSTTFPKGFDPEAHGMIPVDKDGNLVDKDGNPIPPEAPGTKETGHPPDEDNEPDETEE